MKKNKKKLVVLSEPNFVSARKRNRLDLNYVKVDSNVPTNLLEWGKGKHYCFHTFGCQGNIRDSEFLKGYLQNMGMDEVFKVADADLVLFNTCAIRENAENKLFGELGQLKRYYEKNPNLVVILCGCVMQEEKPLEYIKNHFPFVSIIFGTFNIHKIYEYLNSFIFEKNRILDVESKQGEIIEGMPSKRESEFKAFVNIMYGCDKFCSYCIVPYTRGQQRSRKAEDIIQEVLELKEKGYKEVTLVGQNVNSYGLDLSANEKTSFAELLERVALTNIPRIRFTTSHPFDFNEKVFDMMAKYDNIMPSLHLPLQSGSDKVLRKMNRIYDSKRYRELVSLLRSKVKDVALTTDIIVGFPNETLEDFNMTLDLCKEISFDSAYTFIFSPREGTPAYKMENCTSDEEISRRFRILKETIDSNTEKIAKEYVGKTVNVLFDSVSKKNKDRVSGYDEHNKLVHVPYQDNLIGQIKKVKIIESHTFSFLGEVLDD